MIGQEVAFVIIIFKSFTDENESQVREKDLPRTHGKCLADLGLGLKCSDSKSGLCPLLHIRF